MTQQQYIINRKVNIVELAQTLGNISEACRNLGVSRQHYYDIKGAIAEDGIEGLLEKSRRSPRVANRISPEIEKLILEYALEYPTHGQARVENELKAKGIRISSGGVRGVWGRHNLLRKTDRLKHLEKYAAESGKVLTESQVVALENAKEAKETIGEIETYHPGFLLGQDTYYVGYIKGVGKIYQQTGIDTFSNVGFAKLYMDKTAITAADFLNDKVLPFFDLEQVKLLRVLTDRGTEYSGKIEQHPYQLFLHLNDIEHSRTKAYHPQTNGCTERLNQIIQEEFYAVAFRKTHYKSLEQIQTDLDTFMTYYNEKRTNQGKRCQGRTPKQTWDDGYELYTKYVLEKEASTVSEANVEGRPNEIIAFESQKSIEDGAAPTTLSKLQSEQKEVEIKMNIH